jgi:YidC/Oxa1 family membrane protein insertase
VTRLQQTLVRLAPILLLVALALFVAACSPLGGTASGGSPGVTSTPSQAPLEPATPGANPISLVAWLFTPIFQTLFIGLVFLDQTTKIIWSDGNIVVAIILLTIALRLLVIPLYRRQLVSSRQMQLLQPEIKELQRKYKGDRVKAQTAVSEFYKARGVNPAGGCLPIILTMGLLIPMYSVFSQGLTNYDPSAMWHVFGINLFPNIVCPTAPEFNAAGHVVNSCLNAFAFGVNWGIPEPATTGLIIAGFGISILAIISSLSQLVASRMTLPPHDPKTADDQNVKLQRQMAYFLPLISILWGSSLPAGLFLYWITSTLIQIIQQYFILGWGGMFPLFGWFPEFARNHKPRYPVAIPAPKPPAPGQNASANPRSTTVDRDLSARSTIRPNRTRTARRGRRR